MRVRCSMTIMCVDIGRAPIVGHPIVVMIVQRRSWQRRACGHCCGSETVERYRQQRDPDDQDFQNGFHAPILAYARVSESIPGKAV